MLYQTFIVVAIKYQGKYSKENRRGDRQSPRFEIIFCFDANYNNPRWCAYSSAVYSFVWRGYFLRRSRRARRRTTAEVLGEDLLLTVERYFEGSSRWYFPQHLDHLNRRNHSQIHNLLRYRYFTDNLRVVVGCTTVHWHRRSRHDLLNPLLIGRYACVDPTTIGPTTTITKRDDPDDVPSIVRVEHQWSTWITSTWGETRECSNHAEQQASAYKHLSCHLTSQHTVDNL